MDVRKAVKHRENYDSIVTYFKTLKTPGMDQMVLLIDTIEQMSPEIYEHYRALQDMFRIRLKAMLAGEIRARMSSWHTLSRRGAAQVRCSGRSMRAI